MLCVKCITVMYFHTCFLQGYVTLPKIQTTNQPSFFNSIRHSVVFEFFLPESIVELIAFEFPNVVVSELSTSSRSPEAEVETKLGRNFKLLSGSILEEYSVVFIGRDGPTLSNIALTFLGMFQKVHLFFKNNTLILNAEEMNEK